MARPMALRILGIVLVLLGVIIAALAVVNDRPSTVAPDIVVPSPDASPEATRTPQPPIDRSRVHVDAATGSDDGEGSEDAPLATIQAAVDLADDRSRAGLPTTVVIAPGIYREEVELRPAPDATTSGPIILEGAGEGVVVSGADAVRGTDLGGDLWELPWDEDWGPSDLPDGWAGTIADPHFAVEPLLRRRELVVTDGRLLAPRSTFDAVATEEGTFVVLEDEDRIVVHAAGADEDGFEVGAREILLKVDGRRGVEVRGLTFRHAATRIQRKAVIVLASDDVLLEDLLVTQNSWFGLGFTDVRGAVVRRVVADQNGVGGMTAFAVDDLLVEDSTTSHNGWRAGLSAPSTRGDAVIDLDLLDFASGQKFFRLRGATFRRHEAIGNVSNGLWFDFDNIDVVVEDATIRDNGTQGIFVEANQGPVTIRRSTICGNEVGVLVTNSRQTSITSTTLGDNVIAQLFVAGQPERGITTREGEDLTLTTDGLHLRGLVFASSTGQHAVANRLSDAAWRDVLATLRSEGNTFLAEPDAGGLQLPGGDRVRLSSWQDATGQDQTSTSSSLDTRCPAAPILEATAG